MDWTAVVLGIVEGITEFLPISSTGHLLIAEHWLGARSDLFNIVIQAGAMLAVTIIYRHKIWGLITGWRDRASREYFGKVTSAFLITAVLGFAVKAAGVELPSTLSPVAWALVIGGLWMFLAEYYAGRKPPETYVTWKVVVAVGVAQVVAGVFPGVSRSGATIFAAMLAGTTDRAAATEFAFLTGIPTMFAASAFEIIKATSQHGSVNQNWTAVAIGFVVATLTAFVAVKWLLTYIQAHRFTPFAVYRVLLGGALLVLSATATLA